MPRKVSFPRRGAGSGNETTFLLRRAGVCDLLGSALTGLDSSTTVADSAVADLGPRSSWRRKKLQVYTNFTLRRLQFGAKTEALIFHYTYAY